MPKDKKTVFKAKGKVRVTVCISPAYSLEDAGRNAYLSKLGPPEGLYVEFVPRKEFGAGGVYIPEEDTRLTDEQRENVIRALMEKVAQGGDIVLYDPADEKMSMTRKDLDAKIAEAVAAAEERFMATLEKRLSAESEPPKEEPQKKKTTRRRKTTKKKEAEPPKEEPQAGGDENIPPEAAGAGQDGTTDKDGDE